MVRFPRDVYVAGQNPFARALAPQAVSLICTALGMREHTDLASADNTPNRHDTPYRHTFPKASMARMTTDMSTTLPLALPAVLVPQQAPSLSVAQLPYHLADPQAQRRSDALSPPVAQPRLSIPESASGTMSDTLFGCPMAVPATTAGNPLRHLRHRSHSIGISGTHTGIRQTPLARA